MAEFLLPLDGILVRIKLLPVDAYVYISECWEMQADVYSTQAWIITDQPAHAGRHAFSWIATDTQGFNMGPGDAQIVFTTSIHG